MLAVRCVKACCTAYKYEGTSVVQDCIDTLIASRTAGGMQDATVGVKCRLKRRALRYYLLLLQLSSIFVSFLFFVL